MRVFFSYARKDKKVVLQLAKLSPFIKAWVDLQDLSGAEGRELNPAIKTAIDNSHVLIAILSRHSLASEWVCREVSWALARENERQKTGPDRCFVLPVRIESTLDLSTSPDPLCRLATRLHVDVDRSPEGIRRGRDAIENALFRWTCEWIDHVEPEGGHNRRFIEELGKDLLEFQTRLFAVKAILAWPLLTLVREDAVAELIAVKDRYNEFTSQFIPDLKMQEEEVRWRFGSTALKAFTQLATFIRNDIYQGAAFALNDIIESVNAYEPVLSKDPQALASAESRRQLRVTAMEPMMAELVRRTSAYIDILQP